LSASDTTARPSSSRPEANERLMETILGRENMMAAYRRVVVNKGAPGIDKMTVDQLKPYLAERAHQGRPAGGPSRSEDMLFAASVMPTEGSNSVLLTFHTVKLPVCPSRAQMSVNVRPESTPIRYVDCFAAEFVMLFTRSPVAM